MDLSFVIPVYNAAQFVENCVKTCMAAAESLGMQAEVVLVDDGSTDGSSAMCDDLSDRYGLIVRHQSNQGVSSARNVGIEASQGRWIWFVDADDYLDAAVCVNTKLTLESANFVLTGFVWEENGTTASFGPRTGEVPYNLWRCWFRRDLLQAWGLRFTVGRKYAEDQEFVLNYFLKLKSVHYALLNVPVYHYTIRQGSAMTRTGVRTKKCRDIASVLVLFTLKSVRTGRIAEHWCRQEIKRMTKTLIVTCRT